MLPEHERASCAQISDAFENLEGSAFTKTRQGGETSVTCGLLELLQRLDLQPIVNLTDSGRPQSRHAQHFQHSFRRFLLQPFEERGAIRFDKIAQHIQRGWRDRIVERQRALHGIGKRLFATCCRGARGQLHRAYTETILAVQLKERGDLGQDVCSTMTIHACNISSCVDAGV